MGPFHPLAWTVLFLFLASSLFSLSRGLWVPVCHPYVRVISIGILLLKLFHLIPLIPSLSSQLPLLNITPPLTCPQSFLTSFILLFKPFPSYFYLYFFLPFFHPSLLHLLVVTISSSTVNMHSLPFYTSSVTLLKFLLLYLRKYQKIATP